MTFLSPKEIANIFKDAPANFHTADAPEHKGIKWSSLPLDIRQQAYNIMVEDRTKEAEKWSPQQLAEYFKDAPANFDKGMVHKGVNWSLLPTDLRESAYEIIRPKERIDEFKTITEAAKLQKEGEEVYRERRIEAYQSAKDEIDRAAEQQIRTITDQFSKAMDDVMQNKTLSLEAKNRIISYLGESKKAQEGIIDKTADMIKRSSELQEMSVRQAHAGETAAFLNTLKNRAITDPNMLLRMSGAKNTELEQKINELERDKINQMKELQKDYLQVEKEQLSGLTDNELNILDRISKANLDLSNLNTGLGTIVANIQGDAGQQKSAVDIREGDIDAQKEIMQQQAALEADRLALEGEASTKAAQSSKQIDAGTYKAPDTQYLTPGMQPFVSPSRTNLQPTYLSQYNPTVKKEEDKMQTQFIK